ncbi:MAG: helicase-associated domain-containing protein [Isosphaeraceae bacterium]|nr:helicase-associated domain-containing protein [Isosphaeraceae bacterium]
MQYRLRRQARPARPFSEKSWNRRALIPWDERWHALSPEARGIFLDAIEPRASQNGIRLEQSPSAPRSPALKQLEDQGFVVITPHTTPPLALRVTPNPKARDFTLRMRAIKEHQLLTSPAPTGLVPYVLGAYYVTEGLQQLGEVLRKARMEFSISLDQIVQRWVTRRYWPEWAAAFVKSPLKDRILRLLREADGPLALDDLAGKLPDAQREDVRAAVDEMVAYLILFEDLQPETFDLVIDYLPAVRASFPGGSQRLERPPLVVCEHPEQVAPEGGTVVSDLRAYLLEVASEPPRLKQDASLFAKEVPRFHDILEPYPRWLPGDWTVRAEDRLHNAARLARQLDLVRPSTDQGGLRLHVTSAGQQWLGGGLETQFVSVYKTFNQRSNAAPYSSYYYGTADTDFLGAPVAAGAGPNLRKLAHSHGILNVTEADVQALRAALFQAFEALPLGVYHRLDSVLEHLSFDAGSPFNLGRAPGSVIIAWGGRVIPDFKEEREEVGRRALGYFIRDRLVPVGALRLALASGGALCVARTPLLAAYFGRPGLKLDQDALATGDTRVVVQPDFSVIIIGLNPAPAAALAPFCERANRQPGSGALVLNLTRTSVLKAVGQGLPGGEILARLQKHASNGLPANVEREVRDWCGWVRSVDIATLTVVRCGDRATADRVVSALGKRAERLNDTIVALAVDRLTAAERAKLQSQGILVRGDGATRVKKSNGKRRRTRAEW